MGKVKILLDINRAQMKLLEVQQQLIGVGGDEPTALLKARKELADVAAMVHPVGSSGSPNSGTLGCPHCGNDLQVTLT